MDGIEIPVSTFQKYYLYFQFRVRMKSILLHIIDSGLCYIRGLCLEHILDMYNGRVFIHNVLYAIYVLD